MMTVASLNKTQAGTETEETDDCWKNDLNRISKDEFTGNEASLAQLPAYGTTCWVKSFPENHMKPWEMSVLDARNLKGFYGFRSLLWKKEL